MRKLLLILTVIVLSGSVKAGSGPTKIIGNAGITNLLVATTKYGADLYWVYGYSATNVTQYLQVFHYSVLGTNTSLTNGMVPVISQKVSASAAIAADFGANGVKFDGVIVALSQTGNSYTACTNPSSSLQAVISQ